MSKFHCIAYLLFFIPILYLASHDIFILIGSLLYEMMAVDQDNRTSLLSLATNPLSPPSLMPLGNAGANYSVPIYITIYDSYMTPATAQVGIIVSINRSKKC